MRFLSTFDLDSAFEGQGRQRGPVAQAHPDHCCMRMRAECAFSELEKVFGRLTVKVRKRRSEFSGAQNPLRALHHAKGLPGMVGASGSHSYPDRPGFAYRPASRNISACLALPLVTGGAVDGKHDDNR